MTFAPMLLTPHFVEKAWGGQTMAARYGLKLPYAKTGEAWIVSTLKQGESLYDGKPLSFYMEKYGKAFVGTQVADEFPLLIKLLDAQEPLSVQVHPDDAYARKTHGDPYGKNEAWVVLNAKPDAELIVGYTGDAAELEKSAYDGTLAARLKHVPVRTGDVLFIPAGTVHAIGAGILIYEIQQPSDRTYRFYAYDRPGVELDTVNALRVSRQTGVTVQHDFPTEDLSGENGETVGRHTALLQTSYFALDKLELCGTLAQETDEKTFCCYTVLSGSGVLRHAQGEIAYQSGQTVFVPANVGRFTLEGGTLLKAMPPLVGEQ